MNAYFNRPSALPLLRARAARALMLLLVAGTLAACASATLKPAKETRTVEGKPLAAVTENEGVRMVVEPSAWSANPDNLDTRVLPLKVTITNESDAPVRVRYDDFALEAGPGTRYTPLPPIEIRGAVTQYADRPVYVPAYRYTPRFTSRGFMVAPWYMPYYAGGLRPWRYPWAYSPFYYDTYYPSWKVNLPTSEMVELAIPEGVIEPGGSVTGFLYFQRISGELERVTFKANLMDGRDGKRLGALELPFDVS